MKRGKILERILVIGALALGSQLLAAAGAAAYDFKVCAYARAARYVHVHTVSAFCHDRTPVDNGDKPLAGGCVSGSTAAGCLIDEVEFITTNNEEYKWSSLVGVAGGRFTLKQYVGQDPFVCYDGWRKDC